MEVNIVAPRSSTSNNIYSFSEILYMSRYLKGKGYTVSYFLFDREELSDRKELLSGKNNVIILQWDGQELIKWMDTYSHVEANRTIIFGVTAQVYGDFIVQDYPFVDFAIKSYSYSCVHAALNARDIQVTDYDIEEISAPDTVPEAEELPIIPIVSSRGCPNGCNFCAVNCCNTVRGVYKAKSAGYIVSEIKEYVMSKGKNVFYFTDSCFVTRDSSNKKRAREFAQRIIEEGLDIRYYIETRVDSVDYETFYLMKKSGLRRVLLGVENTHPDVIKRYNKRINTQQIVEAINILKALKINMDLTFILFDPFTTKEELLHNLNFILDAGLLEYVDFRGVFRRLILIPQNRILDKDQTLMYKDNNSGLPDWMHKSYHYKIIDPEVQALEDFISSKLDMWENFVKALCSDIKSIVAKRNFKIALSRVFLEAIREILMLPGIRMQTDDMAALFKNSVSVNPLIKNYYKGDASLWIEKML